MLREYFQSLCKAIGNYACYLLCLIHVAEEYTKTTFNKIEVICKCIEKGYVNFNLKNYDDDNNFFVREPAKILNMLTGKTWEVRWEGANYIPKLGEYAIENWSKTNKTGHFAMVKIGFNSLQRSKNVSEGKIINYRICKVVA